MYQLVRKADGNDVTTFNYDLHGNLVGEKNKSKTQTYTFDATNHLVRGTDVQGNASNYTYNALFKRINNTQVSHSGQVYARDYIIDYNSLENNDIMVFADGEYIQQHVYKQNPDGHSERLMQLTDTAPGQNGNGGFERVLYVHEDVQGNTRYYTKAVGQTFAELQYDAWGHPLSPNKLVNNDHGNFVAANYTGHTYDTVLDMYFAEARFYDANNRQWISRDPAKDGLNWYKYVEGNPVSFWDPLGLEHIVVSGGAYSTTKQENGGYYYEFIDAALKQLDDLKKLGDGETLTWMVADAGWTQKDKENFQKTADKLGYNLVFFSDNEDFYGYLGKDGRSDDLIKNFVSFSHGIQGIVPYGFNYGTRNKKLDFSADGIPDLSAYFDTTGDYYSKFYSCNTATGGAESFAQAWANATGQVTYGVVGQTNYTGLAYQLPWHPFKWLERKIQGYNNYGNEHDVGIVSTASWADPFYPMI